MFTLSDDYNGGYAHEFNIALKRVSWSLVNAVSRKRFFLQDSRVSMATNSLWLHLRQSRLFEIFNTVQKFWH